MSTVDERVLIEALDAFSHGEPVNKILADFPEHREELQPVLETVSRLSRIKIAHTLEAQATSKRQFLARAEALKAGAERPKAFAGIFRRLALSVAPLVMILVIVSAGLIVASQSAIPGDALYGAKRAVEDLRFSLTIDSQARQSLNMQFDQERIQEINALLKEGKTASVEFSGFVEVIEDESWIIAGLHIRVVPATKIEGVPRVGHMALVTGRTSGGQLTGIEIVITAGGITVPDIGPTPNISEESEETDQTPTPTPSETPQPSPAPTESVTPTGTLTTTPSPPASTTPLPTSTADDDGEDDPEPEDDDPEPDDDDPEPDDDDL